MTRTTRKTLGSLVVLGTVSAVVAGLAAAAGLPAWAVAAVVVAFWAIR